MDRGPLPFSGSMLLFGGCDCWFGLLALNFPFLFLFLSKNALHSNWPNQKQQPQSILVHTCCLPIGWTVIRPFQHHLKHYPVNSRDGTIPNSGMYGNVSLYVFGDSYYQFIQLNFFFGTLTHLDMGNVVSSSHVQLFLTCWDRIAWLVDLLMEYMGVEPKIGWFVHPKWMVYIGKPYEQMDDLGVPLFLETPIYVYVAGKPWTILGFNQPFHPTWTAGSWTRQVSEAYSSFHTAM